VLLARPFRYRVLPRRLHRRLFCPNLQYSSNLAVP